jgi:hypothetical protein
MVKKLTKTDGKWLLGISITIIAGLFKIWTFDIKEELIIPAIKLIYSLFFIFAIAIATYVIVFKMKEDNKNGKKK